jgi:hypothetical protein
MITLADERLHSEKPKLSSRSWNNFAESFRMTTAVPSACAAAPPGERATG